MTKCHGCGHSVHKRKCNHTNSRNQSCLCAVGYRKDSK